MAIVFYYAPMSSAVQTTWALEELGVNVERVKLDLKKGDQKKPEYLALNPNGKVPTLVVDGTPIFETLAIANYLGEQYGVAKGMYPSTPLERAAAMKWMTWTSVTLGDAMSRYGHAGSEHHPKELHHEPSRAKAKADIEHLVGMLDAELKKNGKDYLLGSTFTIADLHCSGWCAYLGMIGIDLSKWSALGAWVKRCTERPAFGKAMSER
jgi:glutathione S-transferase